MINNILMYVGLIMKTSKRLAACVLVAFIATSVVPSTGFAVNDNTEIVNGKPSGQPPAKPSGTEGQPPAKPEENA